MEQATDTTDLDQIARQIAELPAVKQLMEAAASYMPNSDEVAQFAVGMLGHLAAAQSYRPDEWQAAVHAGHMAVNMMRATRSKDHTQVTQARNGNA